MQTRCSSLFYWIRGQVFTWPFWHLRPSIAGSSMLRKNLNMWSYVLCWRLDAWRSRSTMRKPPSFMCIHLHSVSVIFLVFVTFLICSFEYWTIVSNSTWPVIKDGPYLQVLGQGTSYWCPQGCRRDGMGFTHIISRMLLLMLVGF